MNKQKTLNVKQDLLDELDKNFPDVPFTKLVDRGLKLLLNPDIVNKKVTLDDDTMAKMDRLFNRVYELHEHVLK